MELIDQHTKEIMEGCKRRAKDAGLRFNDETLEYIVTNRDLLELSPKFMIPTLYDYWVHDVEVLKEKGRYELYPSNPYETVINTKPPISFYNDNNPDWLNVMIFYHVLAHIDFFQNNLYFRHTWDYDFNGQALSDKRLIAKFRSEKGHWVDYIIEFARGIDNLVGYFHHLSQLNRPPRSHDEARSDYYFDFFIQQIEKFSPQDFVLEIDRFNQCVKENGVLGDQAFFIEVKKKYPEFENLYARHLQEKSHDKIDLMQFIIENSSFLRKEENDWMKVVIQVVRNTSMFFQPQIRTKIMNEGWASYWHDRLFLRDERIRGHEVEYARVNAGVTSMPRVGLNPYALGMRMFANIKRNSNQGRYSYEFQKLTDSRRRKDFDSHQGLGMDFIFKIRENLCDYLFIQNYIDQDFIDEYNLFVVGKRLNAQRMVWEYYIKSRRAEDYRQMLDDSLYHPPNITVEPDKTSDNQIYLNHHFEGKPLYADYIANTMLGIEFLWGGAVMLETTEVTADGSVAGSDQEASEDLVLTQTRVLYTMENRKLSKKTL